MNETDITDHITNTYPDVEIVRDFGYTMFFYKSDHKLSFATFISADYEYDRYSDLNRPGVYRLNIGISKPTFQSLFGKDEINVQEYDFTALDVIIPHPEYASYHFICVLSPSKATFERIRPLLAEAYDIAVRRFNSQNKQP